MRMPFVTSIVATACLTGFADAVQQRIDRGLTIGDRAPDLDVSYWMQGDRIDGFNADRIYVIEFWATWCRPCVDGMPQLSQLQEEYREHGVSIVGITDEPAEKVRTFLRERSPYDGKIQGQRARYTLAIDRNRATYQAYMNAAGETGIPTTFIVGRNGHVEWIGHPTFLEPVLDRIVKGAWDRDAAKKIRDELEPRLVRAFAIRKWGEALRIIDEIIETDPAQAQQYEAQKFTLLLTETDRAAEAYDLGDRLVKRMWDDAHFLNQIAWFVVDNPDVQSRDLEFAQRVADRANELTNSADAMILDTVARVHYEKGDFETAIEWQTSAVEHLNESVLPRYHIQIRDTLKLYRTKVKRSSVDTLRSVDD